MGAIPCGDSEKTSYKKIRFIPKKNKILRSSFNLKLNPKQLTKKGMFFKNNSNITLIGEELENKQILLKFKVILLKPKKLEFSVYFETKNGDKTKLECIEEKFILEQNKPLEQEYYKPTNFLLSWGGIEEILNNTKKHMDSIIELYNQNYTNIEEIQKMGNNKPYHLDENTKKTFVDADCLYKFKDSIKKKILSKLKYHYLKETRIKTIGQDKEFVLYFEFWVIDFIEKKLDEKYCNLEMCVK